MHKNVIKLISIYFLISISHVVLASELVILTSASNKQELPVQDVARLFLGKKMIVADGNKLVPLNLSESDPIYEEFSRRVLKKSVSQLRAYWAKLIFTGKARPPTVVSREQLIDSITNDSSYIGYLDEKKEEYNIRWIIVD